MASGLHRGILITFEGIDGTGKTTQVKRLAAALRGLGLEVVETREPTNREHGQRIRASATTGRMSPQEEFEAFRLDRQQHVNEVIQPALDQRSVVIVDRYFVSSAAYQGARGLSPESILEANEAFAPLPDAVYFLDITVEQGLSRISDRGDGSNLFELEEDLRKVRDIFHGIRRPYMVPIDGSGSVDDVANAITRHLFEGPLFRATCHVPDIPACTPAFCEHRISGECSYPVFGALEPDVWAHLAASAVREIEDDEVASNEKKSRARRGLRQPDV